MKDELSSIKHFIAFILIALLFFILMDFFNLSDVLRSFAAGIFLIVTGLWGNIAKMVFIKFPANKYTYKIINYIIVLFGFFGLFYSGYHYYPYLLISNDIAITKLFRLNDHFYEVAGPGKYLVDDIKPAQIIYKGHWDFGPTNGRMATSYAGDSASLLFKGQMLTIGFGNLYGGAPVEIKIDGSIAGTINTFKQTTWSSGHLTEEIHELEIINSGKYPKALEVQYIEVSNLVPTITPAKVLNKNFYNLTPTTNTTPISIETAQATAGSPKISVTPTRIINNKTPQTNNLHIGSFRYSSIDGMKLLYVPEGEFIMGTEVSDDDQKPQHSVYLDSFWVDQTVVTNGKYKKCVKAGICDKPSSLKSFKRPDYFTNDAYNEYPVIYVNWFQADTYCKWAGRRLPTEAEWEKAARGTDGRKFPWGEKIDRHKANYNDEYISVGDTSRVGLYPSGISPYGALDMLGNVQEWVADWYDENYYSISPRRNPSGPVAGEFRGIRGISWDSDGSILTYRLALDSLINSNDLGFRCVTSR